MNVLAKLPETMDQLLVMPRPQWLGSPWVKVAAGLLLLVALSGLWRVAKSAWRRAAGRAEPITLFVRVAGQLGLGWADCWVLWRIARQAGLASPLTLLLSGSTLIHHAGHCAEQLPTDRAQRLVRRARAIGRRLTS